MPEVCNLLGYAIGVIISFYLNKKYNFKTKQKSKQEFIKFLYSMLFAYILNLIAMSFSYRILKIDKYMSQIIGAFFYTISGYYLSKKWVFYEKNYKS